MAYTIHNNSNTKRYDKIFHFQPVFALTFIFTRLPIIGKYHVFLHPLETKIEMADFSNIRIVEDFPTPGIKFYDITTLLNDSKTYRHIIAEMSAIADEFRPDVVVAIEARGYFFGPAVALKLKIPFVPIRKAGKLPYHTYSETYDLEYGSASIEIHTDAMQEGRRVLLIDDVLATGGSMNAAAKLLSHFHPQEISMLFLMELTALHGRKTLQSYKINSLIQV